MTGQTVSARIRFRRWRVRQATRLFNRSRTARLLFASAIFPPVWIADTMRGIDPPARWATAMHWVRTGRWPNVPTIRTADKPATVRRRGGTP